MIIEKHCRINTYLIRHITAKTNTITMTTATGTATKTATGTAPLSPLSPLKTTVRLCVLCFIFYQITNMNICTENQCVPLH